MAANIRTTFLYTTISYGFYGMIIHYLASIRFWMEGCLWIWQLSITIMEFGAGNGHMLSRSPSIKDVNISVQNDPSTISQWRMPSTRERAGRTEKLRDSQLQSQQLRKKTYRHPCTKNALRCAFVPLIDHACPR